MWEKDREAWLADLIGHHSLGVSARPADTTSTKELTAATTGALAIMPSSTSTGGNAWSQTPALMLDRGNREGPLDPRFAVEHWNVVRQPWQNPLHTAEALQKMVADASRNQRPDAILMGYSTGWELTTALLTARSLESPVDRACATLVHLCRQFENSITMRVQSAIGSGAVTESPMFSQQGANVCQLYVSLLFGSNHNVWTILYYCLRIGDAKAAVEVWANMADSLLSDAHRDAIARILQAMASADVGCLWKDGIPTLPSAERRALEEMIDRQNSPNDIHYKGVLALLTGHQDFPSDDNTLGFCNLEDFLFGRTGDCL